MDGVEMVAGADPWSLSVAGAIAGLRREGDLLVSAAVGADLDLPIPWCPEWRLRDLLRHLGGVHRWATAHVAQRRTRPMDAVETEQLMGSWPGDSGLVDWVRVGHAALIQALEIAAPDLACWSFLPAPSPLAFWARRQAHETGIHRADVESALGPISAFPPAFAADGIDELLYGFSGRKGVTLGMEEPRAIQLQANDAGREWLIPLTPEGVHMHGGPVRGVAECAVHGGASDLYLLLWNRRAASGLEVLGDAALLDLWRKSVHIRWS